ncbi:MAG: hypothetical protein SGI90_06190 [Candidatus Eisenbacteria bacterium]|nr:hypothetical protein [Candidatus Eisenbacteria bacterium]
MSRPQASQHPLARIDRRWIFLLIAVSVIIPMLFKLKIPTRPSPVVQAIYDKIETLPAGSRILVSLDFAPGTLAENWPMSATAVRHVLSKGHKLYLMTLWATGPDIITRAIDEIVKVDFPSATYGIDYVNLGYKAGNQGVINSLGTKFKTLFTGDATGTPTDQIELTKPINSVADFDLIIAIGSGFPGVKEWIQFAGDRSNVAVAGGVTAVEAPLLYPYYPRQLLGLMGGLQGAAEYEAAFSIGYPEFLAKSEDAISKMGPQTVAHLVILALIIVGNVAYFLGKSNARGGRA